MAKVTPFYLDSKYSALRTLIIILYIIAALLSLAGIIDILRTNELTPMSFIPLIVCITLAFNFVVMAQIISVFLDMEWNQRETNGLLEQVIKNLPEQQTEGK